MPLVIATSNPGKVDELRHLLPEGIRLLSIRDLGITLPAETGSSYLENAVMKAAFAAKTGHAALADDSGLEIDALDGAPGVRSARFAREGATDAENNEKAVQSLVATSGAPRTARFRSVVVLITPDGRQFVGNGSIEGNFVKVPRGLSGFGYDPHFELDDPLTPAENGKTIAELTDTQKNSISHRARAVESLLTAIEAAETSLSELTGDR